MATKTKSPLWFKIISTPLYKLGIVTVYQHDLPDLKWSLTFFRSRDA